jgi:hypothetical protein
MVVSAFVSGIRYCSRTVIAIAVTIDLWVVRMRCKRDQPRVEAAMSMHVWVPPENVHNSLAYAGAEGSATVARAVASKVASRVASVSHCEVKEGRQLQVRGTSEISEAEVGHSGQRGGRPDCQGGCAR